MRTTRTMGADPRIALVNGVPIGANRFMRRETLQVMQERMSSEQWRREGLGQAFAQSGLCLRSFDPRIHLKPKPSVEQFKNSRAQWEMIAGIDYGFSDATAKVWLAVNAGRYFVTDEYEESGRTLKVHAEQWALNPWDAQVKWRYDDPSLPLARAELEERGVKRIFPGNNDVEAGIDTLNRLFETGKLVISDHCVKLLDAIGTWARNKKTGKPEHPGDVLAALRYAVLTHSLANDGKPVPQGWPEDGTGKVKWKLPDGTVTELTEEAPELKGEEREVV